VVADGSDYSDLSELSLEDARADAQALTAKILDAREPYYGRDTVVVDDATYDASMQRL
jgi:DNA ligase (NAD+)